MLNKAVFGTAVINNLVLSAAKSNVHQRPLCVWVFPVVRVLVLVRHWRWGRTTTTAVPGMEWALSFLQPMIQQAGVKNKKRVALASAVFPYTTQAAIDVYLQGKNVPFWELHDAVNQASVSMETIERYRKDLSLSLPKHRRHRRH